MPPFFVGNKGIILLLSKMGKGGFGMSGVKGCGRFALGYNMTKNITVRKAG